MGAPPARPPQQESGPIPPQGRAGVVDISQIPAAQADLKVIRDYRQNPGLYQGPKGAALYKQAQDNLDRMIKAGVAVDQNGVVGAIAGSLEDPAHKGRVRTEEERAVQREQAPYKFEERQMPDGSKVKIRLDQLVGAGTPMVSEEAKDVPERRVASAKAEEKMIDNFQQRQIARERLEKMRDLAYNFESGMFRTDKANLLAAAKSLGFPLSKEAENNPALVQQFIKNSTAVMFDQLRLLGGRILVMEMQKLGEANANPNLEPAANTAILNQGLGLLDYEDQYHKDYFGWRKNNRGNPYPDEFQNEWIAKNSPTKFVGAQNKQGTALGMGLPAFKDLVDGQAYMIGKQPHTWNAATKQFIPK
jgi:hypothetical protein